MVVRKDMGNVSSPRWAVVGNATAGGVVYWRRMVHEAPLEFVFSPLC
jgi:hypothetical protein